MLACAKRARLCPGCVKPRLGLGCVVALVFAHRGFHAHKHGIGHDQASGERRPALTGFLADAWHIDSGYQSKVVMPVRLVAFVTAVVVDQFAIDGLVNGSAALARDVGRRTKRLTDGNLKTYALWMGAGAVVLSFFWMWR